MDRSKSGIDSNESAAVAQDDDDDAAPTLEELKPPVLFGNLTMTENEFGESVFAVYEKVDFIEEGSTGDIWKVRKRKDDQENKDDDDKIYAMKCIDKNFLFGAFMKELRNEIDIMRTIDHPHVVRIYDLFEDRNEMFLIMEYCSGGDLSSRFPYDERQVARILTQILSAVAYCHKHKIVHRDLKLENILFETDAVDANVKLIDFGYSQKYRSPRGEYTMKLDVGTTYTMSPQVIEGEYDEKTDIWGVGVIAYMLLSGGSRPFDAEKNKDIRPKIAEGTYSMEGPEWVKVSEEAKAFIAALLEYDQEKRVAAEQALELSWLQENGSMKQDEPAEQLMEMVQDALLHSTEEPKLKRLSMMLIAHCAPAEKLLELRQAFEALDSSNDGTITYDEFQSAMKNCSFSEEDLREVFNDLDQNQTGEINYTEFLSATLETRGRVEDELREEAFDKLDVDNGGSISEEGLASVLEAKTSETSPELSVKELLDEVGAGDDGKLSFEQFSAMFDRG